ncbi:hypothetical protein [Actinokineospora pegani]|uniref:hypothetical protein n=1 Tax=Actinokineospora pegani TaxID=2654637 RepID=UPI0012E9CD27|nr:hypothetical protein [Actinokineospora pegani]
MRIDAESRTGGNWQNGGMHLIAIEGPTAAESLWLDIGVAAACLSALLFGIGYLIRNRRGR